MTKRNAAAHARDLSEMLDELLEQLALAAARRRDLEAMAHTAHALAARLTEFDTSIVPLELSDTEEHSHAVMAEWEALPAGRYTPGDTEFDRILGSSSALEPLYRSGIDFIGVQKFSDAEQRLATAIAENFEAWHDPWDRLKLTLAKPSVDGSYRMKFDFGAIEPHQRFMTTMEQTGLIANVSLEFYTYKAKQWLSTSPKRISHMKSTPPVRYSFRIGSQDLVGVLTGLWMNAFTFSVVHDQLTRTGKAHELFTNLQYHAPRDVLHADGDFDVLARVDDIVLTIECKSGRLGGKYDCYNEIITKATDVQRVLDMVGSDTRLISLLVYNPHLNKPETVTERLDGSQLVAVRPDELRATIARLVRGSSFGTMAEIISISPHSPDATHPARSSADHNG